MDKSLEELRAEIMGFGENNTHKIYYPELKKKLDELNRFKLLMDNVSDIIIQYDLNEDTIIEVNKSACVRLGYTRTELIGVNIDLIIQNHFKYLIKNYNQAYDDEKNNQIITLFKSKNEDIFAVELNYRIEEFEGKNYAVIIGRDVENRMKEEKIIVESENNLREIFNNTYDAIFILDETGKILEINDKTFTEFHISRERAVGQNIVEFSYNPVDQNNFLKLLKEAIQGKDFTFEWKVKKIDSNQIADVEVVFKSINWYGAKCIALITRNISDKKNVERELNKNRATLKAAIDNLPFDLWIIDKNETIIFQNQASINHWGSQINNNQKDINIEDNRFDVWISKNKRALAGEYIEGEIFTEVYGEPKYLYELLSPIKFEDEIIGSLGAHIDVTERKTMEIALKESEERFKFAFDAVNDAIWDWRPKDSALYCNNKFYEMLGYSTQEFTPTVDFWLSLVHDDDKETALDSFNECFNYPDVNLNIEVRFKRKDDKYVWLQVRGKVVSRNEDEEALRMTGTQTDITLRKELEIELKNLNVELETRVMDRTAQLEDALEELRYEIEVRKQVEANLIAAQNDLENALSKEKDLNTLKSRFISMISHEYRTPLTVIQSSTYLLQKFHELGDTAKFENTMNMVESSLKTMIKLMEDVLTIGRSQEKNKIVNLQSIEIVNFIENIIEEVKIVDKKKHAIELITNEAELFKLTDYTLALKIVSNLISNAVKFSPENSEILVYLEKKSDKIKITIKDSGIGIPENEISYLFEPFYRFSNAIEIQGTGLGLTIVKNSLEALDGTIQFDSVLNQGTTVTVEF